jgi:hypothetical protein
MGGIARPSNSCLCAVVPHAVSVLPAQSTEVQSGTTLSSHFTSLSISIDNEPHSLRWAQAASGQHLLKSRPPSTSPSNLQHPNLVAPLACLSPVLPFEDPSQALRPSLSSLPPVVAVVLIFQSSLVNRNLLVSFFKMAPRRPTPGAPAVPPRSRAPRQDPLRRAPCCLRCAKQVIHVARGTVRNASSKVVPVACDWDKKTRCAECQRKSKSCGKV